MVLYKRKPVQFLPPVQIDNEEAEVWHIPQTGEVFTSYEDFLSRMDFYNQRRFNDQITGQSQMTFFEAFRSEATGGREVEEAFPESLKGPVLRKVQFQTVSRLDHLVDMLYNEFKQDYFPGEEVTITVDNGDKVNGLIRDKTAFGPRLLPDGSLSKPVIRYMIHVKDFNQETSFTQDQIARERGIFTKAMLRSYLKRTVIREAWNGAPWLVKHEYANNYHIDTRVPPHLRYDTKREERRIAQAQKRADGRHDVNGDGNHSGPMRLPELKPAPKGMKGKPGMAQAQAQAQTHTQAQARPEPTPPPPPPPPKYPIEDLALEPRDGAVRPRLKFMCRDPPVSVEKHESWVNEYVNMESVGGLLETWDTLNVYCEVFHLDSFTFDDFVEAMLVASERVPVQMFDEIHCAVLKVLVDSEKAGGKVRITLPELEDEDSEEEEEEEEEDSQMPSPEPEPRRSGRATRSSLAKAEAERLAAEAKEEELKAELQTRHRAEELLADFDWVECLRKRDLADGGWERVMVGLLHQLSKNPKKEAACEELLLQLVPPGIEPTQETVRQQYGQLDINYRVKALQIICLLTMETKAMRNYMEECSEQMTKYRKEKVEWQRQRKQAVEEHRQLNEQRKILLPDNMPPSPPAEPEPAKEEEDSKMDIDESRIDRVDADETDEEPTSRKSRRRGQSEKNRKRGEEAERKEAEKKKAKEEAARMPKQSKEFIKLCKEIAKKEEFIKECETEVATIENDLRENDCPRTRVLGKDRFWNRYYWFERNGMPYGGLPNSSTAHAGYANGCLWIQGPDFMEMEGYINVSEDMQNEYKAKFNMTIPERKTKEENGTSLTSARQWGYISEPDDLVELVKWLDTRGFNEARLRKELLNFKDRIIEHMEKRKAYLGANEDKDKGKREETKRSSNRIRDKTPEPPNYRCLDWENTMAMSELGQLHSEPPPPPPRSRKQTKKREASGEIAPSSKTRRR